MAEGKKSSAKLFRRPDIFAGAPDSDSAALNHLQGLCLLSWFKSPALNRSDLDRTRFGSDSEPVTELP